MSAIESRKESESESVDLETPNRTVLRDTSMAEDLDSKNIQTREVNKLDGASNYQAWKVKMRALFRREGLWKIVERKIIPISFLVVIGGLSVSERRLQMMKSNAYLAIIMSVKDKLFKIVADIDDPADQWNKLADKYQSSDTSQLLMLLAKLHSIKMKEGKPIEEYLNVAEDLKDQLLRMEEDVLDTILVQLVLNEPPRNFDATISSILNMDILPTFDGVSAKLTTVAHRM